MDRDQQDAPATNSAPSSNGSARGGGAGANHLWQAALEYAAYGWKIVPLYGLRTGGGCECRKWKDCPSPGKHPRLPQWQDSASSDEDVIADWGERWPGANIGVRLGAESGIVDIEFDDEAGRAMADKLLKGCLTPTYRSARSVHRLFRYTDRLPQITVPKVNGLECRLGTDKAAQSVLPPSQHHSGAKYQWIDRLAPSQVEPAEMPEALINLLWNVETGESILEPERKPSKGRAVLDRPEIHEGERDDSMLAFACRMARRSPRIDDPQEQADLWVLMESMNGQKFKPPLDPSDLERIFRQAIGYTRQDEIKKQQNYTTHGLAFDGGEWWPGTWQLTVIHSDPAQYRLHVPAWKPITKGQTGNVVLAVEEYAMPSRVAAAVLGATKTVVLDDQPGVWPAIWNGTQGSKQSKGTRGLKAKLLDTAQHENATPDAKRDVIVATIFLEKIEAAVDAKEESPDSRGRPVRMSNGTVWLGWRKAWESELAFGGVTPAEVAGLARTMGIVRTDYVYWPHHGKGRKRYMVLNEQHLDRLQRLATDADSDEGPN